MALSLRKQPGRTLLAVLSGTTLLFFFFNQSDLKTTFTHPAHSHSAGYSHRRIQDYNSPEYTAPGETAGETGRETAAVLETGRDDLAKDLSRDDVLKAKIEVETSGTNSKSVQRKSDNVSDNKIGQDAKMAAIEKTGVNEGANEGASDGEEADVAEGIKVLKEEMQVLENKILTEDNKPVAGQEIPPPHAMADDNKDAEDRDQQVRDAAKDSVKVSDPSDHQVEDAAVDAAAKDAVRVSASRTTGPSHAGGGAKDEVKEEDEGSPSASKVIVRPFSKQRLIDTLVEKQRAVLAQAMEGYTFHKKLKAKRMDDLVLERGGRPVRSIVITTWRSGSTFIGDVLQSHPATYYHYEPLLDFGISQVRYGQTAQQAIHNLRHLLNCNYTNMERYLEYGPDHPWLFLHNTRLWYYCTAFPELCWDKDFLSPFCSLFPFQSLKTVRLRLNLTQEFLEDKDLGVQVLLLVRDPRGTIQSRSHREWCPGNPDCDDPARLCSDLVSDYNTALDFRRKFPYSFRVIRYEDLSFDAYNMTKELFNFFHLNYHPRVQEFLDTHTKEKIGGVSSTFRNSKTAPVHWQNDLSWESVESIQRVCSKALKLWGYKIATDEKHLRSFRPVGIFKFR